MIDIVSETGSTNADLAARLRTGEYVPEGHWLVADRQTRGRGRSGRAWSDGAGNFMGSCIVHRRRGDPLPASLALLAGLALHEVISPLLASPHRAMLKWPNDLMVGRAKLAGILLEGEGDAVIVGIGVNLAIAPEIPDRETVALAQVGKALSRDNFAAELARQFDRELARWRDFGLPPVIGRWCAAAHPVGTRLASEAGDGVFYGLDEDGSLQLRLADGSLRTIHAGEVNLTD